MPVRARLPHIVAVTDQRLLIFVVPKHKKLSMHDLVVDVPMARVRLLKTQSRLMYKLEVRIAPRFDEVTHEGRHIVFEFQPRDRAAGRQLREHLNNANPRTQALAPAFSETTPTTATEDPPPTS